MSADGWVEWETNKGEKQLTFDSEISTKDEAIKKGYTNVDSVNEILFYQGETESYTLNSDGTVLDNNKTEKSIDVGFNPIRTKDGYFISENNQVKSLGSGLQNAGDFLTYLGIGASVTGVGAPLGVVLMTVGEIMNFTGTTIESSYLYSQGKKKEAVTKMIISIFFIGTGKAGGATVKKVAGKEAVENGSTKGVETVVGGANTVIEKTIGKDTENYIVK